jgi:pimeloyl-ACP methyl ester carboxylesterase
MGARIVTTAAGPIEYDEYGQGTPVLVLHGSPGGIDAAELMARFLPRDEFRAILVSRPGYLGTPLGDRRGWDAQADLLAALLDHLGVDRCAVLAWSGGGPPAYRLAVRHPGRVSSIVAVAAVSTAIDLPRPSLSERLMFGTRPGLSVLRWLSGSQPRQVVQGALASEGSLGKERLATLVDYVMNDPEQRRFVLELGPTAGTGGGRREGWTLEKELFASREPLQLDQVTCAVLLVHDTADSDAPIEQSRYARDRLPHAELVTTEDGTHLSFWASENATALQAHALDFLRAHAADGSAAPAPGRHASRD